MVRVDRVKLLLITRDHERDPGRTFKCRASDPPGDLCGFWRCGGLPVEGLEALLVIPHGQGEGSHTRGGDGNGHHTYITGDLTDLRGGGKVRLIVARFGTFIVTRLRTLIIARFVFYRDGNGYCGSVVTVGAGDLIFAGC